jgi:ABC-2 type transport system ATP-binding protein
MTTATTADVGVSPTAVRAPAMSLRGLTKRYGDRMAVDGLTIDVPAGAVAGFVGPNGAGKTTTMAMLLGLVTPSAGDGTVLGEPLCEPGAYLGRVGALIEGPAFYPGLSGARNLAVLATAAGHDPAQIPGLLDLVGLRARADDAVRRYSFGMKQRLGIASALLGDPDLLILDEPINGLDPAGVHEMRGLIGRLASGDRTVLVSSHVLAELEQVCDWLVVIDDGRLVFQGPAAELLDRSGATLVVAPEHEADVERLRGVLAAAGHAVSVAAGAAGGAHGASALRPAPVAGRDGSGAGDARGDCASRPAPVGGRDGSGAGDARGDCASRLVPFAGRDGSAGDARGDCASRPAPFAGRDGSRAGDHLVVAAGDADQRGLAAAINRAAAAEGIVLAELRVARTSLEDRYLSMVQGGDR